MSKKPYDQVMEFLAETITSLLTAKQVPVDLSQQLADGITEQLRLEWGGATIYFPNRVRPKDTAARNKTIIAEFNGSNLNDLTRKYGLSGQTIRDILKAARNQKTNP
jgi:Mor family transcriptional regulator